MTWLLSSSSNLARRDFPETPFETPAGLPRWPFDAFTSNAIVGMVAAAQPPIPDVMLATGLALHRIATNQTLLTDDGGVSVHDWTHHGADNRAVWVDTPFPVVIGTSNYARVGILSNGRLAFGYGTYHRRTLTGLPIDTPYPVVTVAPLWGPFALLPTTSRVWARTEGANAFVIAWEAMLLSGNETHPATAQCVIGRDGTFRFLYGPQPIGAGNLTTVGAQNQGYGWCYSNSHSNRVQDAMGLSLRPAALDGWAEADPDGDSISNYEEFMLGTDPALGDSDGDGPSDRWELDHGFDPMVAQLADTDPDTDGDLIPDGWEAWLGTDPHNPYSGPAFVKDNDLDGFANVYEAALFDHPWDAGSQAPGPVDEDHVDVIAVVDSTRPCVLTISGPDQWVDIPWVPGVSHEDVRLRLKRGERYEVVLSRGPAGSGLSTNGFWWANVRFEAPPEFWGLNGPETVADGVLAYNAHTVRIETPFRPAYDLWLNPGTPGSPFFDLATARLLIDGPLVFCHNTTVGEIALTADSLVTGPVDWTGLPPVTPAQANPLVFDPSTVTPGAYTVVATAADNPWAWAECEVEIHSLGFAESVIWLSATDTNTHTIALAQGSFPTTGLAVWSEPAGIDSLDITPSELEPGIYTVYAWGACGWAEVQVNILSVDFIEASSNVSDNSPQQFEGHQSDFGNPCDPDDPGQAIVVFHKNVRDEDFVVQDYNVTMVANILPASITFDQLSESWAKVAGPSSGSLNRTDTFEVKYQNAKEGGFYQFEFDLGLSGCAKSGANLLLPLGGPDVTAYYLSEAQRYDTWLSTMKARVNAQTTSAFSAGFIIISHFTKTVNHMNHKFGTYEAGSSPCKAHCDNTVTISGYVFGKDHIGNFLFSYLAARTGFTFGSTRLGANLAAALQGQVDLPDDQAAYEVGYAHGQNPSGDFQAILESKDIDAMQNETAKKGWPSTDTATGTNYPTWGATHGGLDNPE